MKTLSAFLIFLVTAIVLGVGMEGRYMLRGVGMAVLGDILCLATVIVGIVVGAIVVRRGVGLGAKVIGGVILFYAVASLLLFILGV